MAATPKPCPANSYSRLRCIRTSGTIYCEQYHSYKASASYSSIVKLQLEAITAQDGSALKHLADSPGASKAQTHDAAVAARQGNEP
jgi:hypothetical protein